MIPQKWMRSDHGVSITLSYMLILGIASMFALLMLGCYYSILGSSSSSLSYYDLRSISGMLELNLDQFQRLVRTGMSSGELEFLELNLTLPSSAAAQSYIAELSQIWLNLSTRDVRYEIPLRIKPKVSTSSGSSSSQIKLVYRDLKLILE